MFEFFTWMSSDWLLEFNDPRKRLYWLYLLCAIAIAVVVKAKRPQSTSFFARNNWWSASARADYQLVLVNRITLFWLQPRLLGQTAVATGLYLALLESGTAQGLLSGRIADGWVALVFTFSLFVVDDFTRFLVHWLMHRIPTLWAFHRVHHTAQYMNPLTVLRVHPIESVLFSLRSALVFGGLSALFLWLFAEQLSLLTVLSANAFNFAFHVLGSNLRHSPVPLRYPHWMERWLLSPAQHQIHHSAATEHRDRNMGVVLACWDRLFGTWHRSSAESLQFGVAQQKTSEQHLAELLWSPFVQAAQAAKHTFFQTFQRIHDGETSKHEKL